MTPKADAGDPAKRPPGTWILLRGLTRDSRHWGDFPGEMAARFEGARVIALDLPGNGVLAALPSPVRVEALANHCIEETRRRGMEPPYHLLALSLGAMVAIAWCDRRPQDIAGCVLINTSVRPHAPFHRRLRPRNYLRLLRLALPGTPDLAWERTVLELTSRLAPERDALLARWIGWRAERRVGRANALRQLLAAARFRAPATPPAAPTLLLASARDGLVDFRCSQRLAKVWGCPLAVHPGAGHDLPLDDGPWVLDAVARWLDGIEPARDLPPASGDPG